VPGWTRCCAPPARRRATAPRAWPGSAPQPPARPTSARGSACPGCWTWPGWRRSPRARRGPSRLPLAARLAALGRRLERAARRRWLRHRLFGTAWSAPDLVLVVLDDLDWLPPAEAD
jgi:hypothetical protein